MIIQHSKQCPSDSNQDVAIQHSKQCHQLASYMHNISESCRIDATWSILYIIEQIHMHMHQSLIMMNLNKWFSILGTLFMHVVLSWGDQSVKCHRSAVRCEQVNYAYVNMFCLTADNRLGCYIPEFSLQLWQYNNNTAWPLSCEDTSIPS